MYTVLILCRSATLAQRTVRQLASMDCPAAIVRPPLQLTESGCSYAVSVSGRFRPVLEQLAHTTGFACTGKLYRVIGDNYEPLSL